MEDSDIDRRSRRDLDLVVEVYSSYAWLKHCGLRNEHRSKNLYLAVDFGRSLGQVSLSLRQVPWMRHTLKMFPTTHIGFEVLV